MKYIILLFAVILFLTACQDWEKVQVGVNEDSVMCVHHKNIGNNECWLSCPNNRHGKTRWEHYEYECKGGHRHHSKKHRH